VGDFEGTVEVQLQAADEWQPVRRNMPVRELSWLRTEGSSRLEIELDDGSVVRLGPDSLAEFSDYTRLSTGQRITLISLDHGIAYFTGAAEGNDSTVLAVPGAQVTVHQNVRLRLEARDPWSLIAAGDGVARYLSPTAEFDLTEGQMVKLDPAHPSRFFLYREVTPLETDRWVDERDKVLSSTSSGAHVTGLSYGLADLDAYGAWVNSADLGMVWKPKVAPGWTPFRSGRWQWYEGLGYTWIADDPWGWLPYHYGRWMQRRDTTWVWSPGESVVFKPGEVYWLKSAKFVGWGALAPGENWKPERTPMLFQNANITYANYAPEAVQIDPANFTDRPQEPLKAAFLALALPSPAFPAARLDAFRPALRAGSTRPVQVEGSVTLATQQEPAAQPTQAPIPVSAGQAYASSAVPNVTQQQPDAPAEVDYYIPVYTGIIVVKPPASKQTAAKKPAKSVPPPASGSNPARPQPPKPRIPEPEKPVR